MNRPPDPWYPYDEPEPEPECQTCVGKGGAWRDVWVVDGWSATFDDYLVCAGKGTVKTEQQGPAE